MKLCIGIGKVLISGSIVLFMLSLFNFMYLYTGTHIDNTTGTTDYKWAPHQY